jgi:hypothetical protein
MSIKRLIAGLAGAPLVAGLAMPALVFAADPVVTVTESDVSRQAEDTPPTNHWVIYTRNAGTAQFRNGPGTPPLGSGSLELGTPTGTDKITAFNYDHVGTKLADVDAVSYSTYRSAGAGNQVASLNMEVDVNGNDDGGFTTLVFEPVYNTDQGAVVNDTWQTWDAYENGNATWWSSNAIPGAPDRDTFVSWNALKAANPNAVIVGGFGVNQGSGNPALTTATDKLTIGANGNTTVYNFEATLSPTDKDSCKNDGWKSFNTPTFKNQGDCVSFVATAKKSTYKLDSADKGGLNIPTKDGWYYDVSVEGTWANRPGELVDAECTNMQSNTWQNAVNGGYPADELDTQINKQFVDWGACDSQDNTYSRWVVGDGKDMNLRVFDGDATTGEPYDGWYNDNVGSLNVTVVAHNN